MQKKKHIRTGKTMKFALGLFFLLAGVVLINGEVLADSEALANSSRLGKYAISLHVGYLKPQEEGMRDFYDNAFTFGGGIGYMFLDEIETEFSFKYRAHEFKQKNDPVKELAVRTMTLDAKYYFLYGDYWAFYSGAGPSYYSVKLKVDNVRSALLPGKIVDNGIGFNLKMGVNYSIFSNGSLTGEVEYSRSFLGDPDLGRFGNIGGVDLTLGIRLSL
ncbi:MAG: outer membrane beta-barrel protein [Candidatus Zixiibacteriota bacterium]